MIEIKDFTQKEIGFAMDTEKALFSDPWSKKDLEEVLFSSYQKALVLFLDSVPAGYLIYANAFDEAEILRIGTAKRFQKRGFAAALLAHLFCILKVFTYFCSVLSNRQFSIRAFNTIILD